MHSIKSMFLKVATPLAVCLATNHSNSTWFEFLKGLHQLNERLVLENSTIKWIIFFLWEKSLVTRQRDSRLTYLHNISFQRPVLVILDRNMDLCTPLHHTWTYQALVHDVLVSHNIILLWTLSALIRFTPKWLESNFSKQYHHQNSH